MKRFLDSTGKIVELSFIGHPFKETVGHVLVICQYEDGWLCTHHKNRGIEFPGGKIECGETLEQAAKREVYEETGAIISTLVQLGEYRVEDPKGPFVKAVFWGEVKQLDEK
ncbi:MAG: NUDIX domain-containing protein, partial [Bacillota bacterium]|nr:NUDIX domain-containing protein [Bacillota bacterium]